jgi:hypothetical protein
VKSWRDLSGDAKADLEIVGEKAAVAISRSVPLLSVALQRMLREKVSPRTMWTLALFLGAWAYRDRYLRFQRLMGSVPALSAALSQSAPFGTFARDLVTAADDAAMTNASRSFAKAAGSIDPDLLLSVLRAPVWQRLEAELASIPIPQHIDLIEGPKQAQAEPPPPPPPAERPKVAAQRERSRARRFDLPIYYARTRAADEEPAPVPDEIRDLSGQKAQAPLTDDARDARSVTRDGRNILLDLGPIGRNSSAKDAIAHLKGLGYSENEINDLLLGPSGGKSA